MGLKELLKECPKCGYRNPKLVYEGNRMLEYLCNACSKMWAEEKPKKKEKKTKETTDDKIESKEE